MNAFRVGTVLATALRVIGRHFLLFTLLAAVTSLPWIVLMAENPVFAGEYADGVVTPSAVDELTGQWLIATYLYPLVLGAMLGGAVSFVTVNHLRGERVSAGAALQQTVRPLVRVLLTNLLVWLRIVLWLLPLFIAVPLLIAAQSPQGVTYAVLFGLGAGCLGFAAITYTKLWFAVPAAVVEGLWPLAACRRSAALTHGHRLPIFVLVVLAYVVLWLAFFVLGIAVQALSERAVLWSSLASQGIACVLTSACAAAGYFSIRQAREVLDVRAMAAAFG